MYPVYRLLVPPYPGNAEQSRGMQKAPDGWSVMLHPSGAFHEEKSGGVLLSHKVPLAVPSALRGLASGFGM
jgi:hypothetical protein